jgi:prolyl oligopeptidase
MLIEELSGLKLIISLAGVFFFCLFVSVYAGKLPFLPGTPKKPVTDEYYGIKVTDDYRWLENFADPAVRKWSDEENEYARAFLSNLPYRDEIYKRLQQISSQESPNYFSLRYNHGIFFALKSQPPKQQPFLITLKSPDDLTSEKVIVDPNKLDTNGTTAIDFYVPSLDGKLVAISLSQKGSEDGTLHIYEVASGKELPDQIPRVNYATAAGSAAWNFDASGFYYTRYPHAGERAPEDMNFYQQVYYHKLGTPTTEDGYVIGKEFPRIAEIGLSTSEDGNYILARVANGDGGEYSHYLMDKSGKWTQVTEFSDKITQAEFGPDNALYMLSLKGTPRGEIIRVPLSVPELKNAVTVIQESDVTIKGFEPTATRLYVVDQVGGPSQIRVFDHKGNQQKPVPIEPVSSVYQVLGTSGDEILFNNTSFVDPPAWYAYNPATGEIKKTALHMLSPVDFMDTEVIREFAVSKDGTKIPLNIIRRKRTKLDGQNPTLLTGYGGFGISLGPSFDATLRIWLNQGGIYAIANLRGGGEYGEEWHKAGNLTKKQNVFDDFIACAQYLIDNKYTNPSKLAIEGGSNGGLLMGAALTQHPELFRAVVSRAGIYDMLRVELDPNGAFNVTEYGSVKNPDQFKALYAYSPYQHVKDGTAYPAIFFYTGEHDARVNPAHSRKMIARLQAATSSKNPILLATSSTSGHGIGTSLSEQIAQEANIFAFLFDQLGVKYKQ